jgi:hypothetical protein
MGGRRARSLSEIVGTGLSAQRANFTRALGEENPEAVATSSAKLLAGSGKMAQIIYYTAKLSEVVRKAVEAGKDLSYEQREELARREWSRVKKEERVLDDPIVTKAIVSSVAKAIGKGRK